MSEYSRALQFIRTVRWPEKAMVPARMALRPKPGRRIATHSFKLCDCLPIYTGSSLQNADYVKVVQVPCQVREVAVFGKRSQRQGSSLTVSIALFCGTCVVRGLHALLPRRPAQDQ